MSKADIWMPLYIGDYLADTMRLTTEQHGAYLLLLMEYWRCGSLPDDDDELASISKLTLDSWLRQRDKLARFFTIECGFWFQKRVEKERAAEKKRRQVAQENGKKGGRPKGSKKPSRNPEHNPEKTHGFSVAKPSRNQEHNPNHNPQKSSSPSPSPKDIPLPSKNRSMGIDQSSGGVGTGMEPTACGEVLNWGGVE